MRKGVIVELFNEQSGLCGYCSDTMTLKLNRRKTATVDHIVPKSKGGASEKYNYVAACNECNQRKGNKPLFQFLIENTTCKRSDNTQQTQTSLPQLQTPALYKAQRKIGGIQIGRYF